MDETTPANPDHSLAFRMAMESKLFEMDMPKINRMVLRPGFMYGLDGHSSISGQWFATGEKGQAIYRGDRISLFNFIYSTLFSNTKTTKYSL